MAGRVADLVGSLRGRIMLLLTIGMSCAALLCLAAVEHVQHRAFDRVRMELVAQTVADVLARIDRDPADAAILAGAGRVRGAHLVASPAAITSPDAAFGTFLRARLAAGSDPSIEERPRATCFTRWPALDTAAAGGLNDPAASNCWLVRVADRSGAVRRIAVGLPRFILPPPATGDPLYLLLILAASAVLAYVTATVATRPLARLTRAARAFSQSLEPLELPEQGPREVRGAIATFNLMQRRLSEGLSERTQMLAAISHDLQTPLTRLRLRLEQVPEETLRAKLIADLAGTHALIREGLELARSGENREPWSLVDIDSLVASLAEDAAEFGAAVTIGRTSGATIRIKPDAIERCLTNLIDNAVKYGGSAEIDCDDADGGLEISIRDRGPGLPEDMLERMFEPFVRGDQTRPRAAGGAGIGLTIARAQARLFGGTVALRNHPSQGLIARLRIERAVATPS